MILKPQVVPESKDLLNIKDGACQKDVRDKLKELPVAEVNIYNIGL